jgi:DNA-binding NarL/FixJ family response regulator
LLDSYQGVLDGYHYRLDKLTNIKIVVEALSGADFEVQLAANPSDVALMALRVPAAADNPSYYPLVHAIPRLLELYPDLAIIVFSGLADPRHIRSIMAAGAKGYVHKGDAQIYPVLPQVLLSIRQAGVFYSPTAIIALRQSNLGAAGQTLLTPRQLQAIALCAAYPRDSLRELAVRMGVSASTIRNLLSQSYERLDVSSRAQAVLRAEKLGLLLDDH